MKYNPENALYGVLAIFVSAQAMDWVIYGGKAAKAVYIMRTSGSRI